MSSRRYPTAELYEERQQDHYRRGPRSVREYDDPDGDFRRARTLDFLDEDYGRSSHAGALVVADRSRPREVERETTKIRTRSVERDDRSVVTSRSHRSRRPREVEKEELDVTIKREESRGPPPRAARPREIERDDISFRHRETPKTHRDDIVIRRGEGRRPPPPVEDFHEDEISLERERGRHAHGDRERIQVRHRSASRPSAPPAKNLISRENEEIVIRRRKPRSVSSLSSSPSPSPPPNRRVREEQIIIRRKEERSRTPTPPPPPPPPPEPEPPVIAPIIRPDIHQRIHQEVITHHRHIDHGVERAYSPPPAPAPVPRSPSPIPVAPPKKTEETLEIDIRRRGSHHHHDHDDELDITIDHNHSHSRGRDHRRSVSLDHRHRSLSTHRPSYNDELAEEAEYYNRKALDRAYVGEAHNGATKDWAIVDVPPGTERVRMDGAGGSSQEISWQRYNGVRRSKFISGDREFDSGFGVPSRRESPAPLPPPSPVPSRPRKLPSDMWTEITKDLVSREAVDAFGYEYEETEFFFYVMEYLKYEDVLQLVEMTDEIRHQRRRRIRELEWERDAFHQHRDRARSRERFHEVIIDRRR